MIIRLSSVTYTIDIGLGETGKRQGRNPLDRKQSMFVVDKGDLRRPEWVGVRLFLDTDIRMVLVTVEGANAPLAMIPLERVERMTPMQDDADVLMAALPAPPQKTAAKPPLAKTKTSPEFA
jgi:hypothetical protein